MVAGKAASGFDARYSPDHHRNVAIDAEAGTARETRVAGADG